MHCIISLATFVDNCSIIFEKCLPTLPQLYLFGYNKSRPISIYDDDYLGREPPGKSIKQKLVSVLRERGVDPVPISRIELVTSARYFGHAFNPVNFYYCFHNVPTKINKDHQSSDSSQATNELLYAMVVEINNTFGETHVHVIKSDESALPLNTSEDPYHNKKVRYYFPLIQIVI